MKFWKLATITTALVISTNLNAALIDNGGYTTDNVNNLDWLDLTYTLDMSYSSAQSNVSNVLGGGWQYATMLQMEQMWYQAFGSIEMRPDSPLYTTEYTAEVDNFMSLFGTTGTASSTSTGSLGIYDDGYLRITGVTSPYDATLDDSLYSPEYYYDYDYARDNDGHGMGTFLVRTSVVPIPPAIWLFGSGLIGLIGVARRKKV